MLDLLNPFKRKRRRALHFALVVADRPTEGFKFEGDKDCEMFMVTGEVVKRDVIPRSVLRAVIERFDNPTPLEGDVSISEKQNDS